MLLTGSVPPLSNLFHFGVPAKIPPNTIFWPSRYSICLSTLSHFHFPSSGSTSPQPVLQVRWLVIPMAAILGIQRSFAGAPQLQEWQLPMPKMLRGSFLSGLGMSWPDAPDQRRTDIPTTPRANFIPVSRGLAGRIARDAV